MWTKEVSAIRSGCGLRITVFTYMNLVAYDTASKVYLHLKDILLISECFLNDCNI